MCTGDPGQEEQAPTMDPSEVSTDGESESSEEDELSGDLEREDVTSSDTDHEAIPKRPTRAAKEMAKVKMKYCRAITKSNAVKKELSSLFHTFANQLLKEMTTLSASPSVQVFADSESAIKNSPGIL